MRNNKNKYELPWFKHYGDIPKTIDIYEGSVSAYVFEQAKKYPDYYAYEYYGKLCTYSELTKRIEKTARSLKFLGITKDDIVTICMPNTPEGVIMFYAINMVGAIANMVHPLSGEKELEFYLNLSKSKTILVLDLFYDKLMNIIDHTSVNKVIVASAAEDMGIVKATLYKTFKKRPLKRKKLDQRAILWSDFISDGAYYKGEYKVKRKKEDPMAILYSGGTTGTPKGVLLSNESFNNIAQGSPYVRKEITKGDSLLSIMPIFHNFGLGVCIHTPLANGMKCILIPTFKASEFGNLIKKYRPNAVGVVPTLLEYLAREKSFNNNDMASVRLLLSGGDTITESLRVKVEKFAREHGASIKVDVGYGLTEAAPSCVTIKEVHKPGSIGIPFPNVIYKIVKIGSTEEVPEGEDGEICIYGPVVMLEYLNNKKETEKIKKTHADGKVWLHTGDVGCIEDGFVYFKQRIKRIIISGGYNIYPTYIEDVLDAHPKIARSAVIGIDNIVKGQVPKAYIVLKDGIELTDELKKEIKVYCRKNIAKYSLPYDYEFRDSLPSTMIGKVSVKELEVELRKNKSEKK